MCLGREPAIRCEITGLGSENPNDVVFTKSPDFPTESQAWEEYTDTYGNKFAKFHKWFTKRYFDANNHLTGFVISNQKEDNDFIPYDCFVDENGNELDYILIGRYCFTSTSQASSVSGERASLIQNNARTLARALGNGYQLFDCMMFTFWRDLTYAIKESVDFNPTAITIENWLGLNHLEKAFQIDGFSQYSGYFLYCKKPSKYVDSPTNQTEGYIQTFALPTDNGCIKSLYCSSNEKLFNMPYETIVDYTYTKYYCDAWTYKSGSHCFVVNIGMGGYKDYGIMYILWKKYGTNGYHRLCYRPIS